MLTIIYSLLSTKLEPFTDATLFVADNGHYLLTIPAESDWTSAEVSINNYPAVDYIIEKQIIEIKGRFFQPTDEVWVDISIAKGHKFGGSYRFSLEIVPIPNLMPRFSGFEAVAELKPTFWWRDPFKVPYRFFWEK